MSGAYQGVIEFDQPNGYWRFDALLTNAVPGNPHLRLSQGATQVDTPIVGDIGLAIRSPTGNHTLLRSDDIVPGSAGDASGMAAFAIELWLRTDGNPGALDEIVIGPVSSANPQYQLYQNTTGTLGVNARNSGGTLHTVTSGAALTAHVWYHVVGTITGGNLRLYLNGAEAASTAWTGAFGAPDSGAFFWVGGTPGGIPVRAHRIDELAFYAHGLTADRVYAHYEAGVLRGFPAQLSGARIGAVLDAAGSHAPRNLDAGVRNVAPRFMTGQDPLGEIRTARNAESVDAVFFAARDGTLVFLDAAHRSSSPYNTVQATFDDDGTDLPYLECDVDFSEAFLFNEILVTRTNGLTKSASDATSISRYEKRPLSLTDLPITLDADAQDIADDLLVKHKDPFTRITSITLNTAVPEVSEAAFRLDLGDKIRLLRTPPGGGARIDQSLWVNKIEWSGANDGKPWTCRLGVSPV